MCWYLRLSLLEQYVSVLEEAKVLAALNAACSSSRKNSENFVENNF